ncbi:MAG: hypothetical protein MJ054_00215 [Clostridia bacterium]|nr:hypothetical protein [Clostridia bacterium]
MKVVKSIVAVLLIAVVSIFSWEMINVLIQKNAVNMKSETEAMIQRGRKLVAQTCESVKNTIKASRALLSPTSFNETNYGKSVIDLDDVGGTSYLQFLYMANFVIQDATTTEGVVLSPEDAEKHIPENKYAYKITRDKVCIDFYNKNGLSGLTYSYNDTETKWICEYFNFDFDSNCTEIYIFEGNLTVADETPMMDKLEVICAELAEDKNYQSLLLNTDDFTAVVSLIIGIVNNAYNPDYTNCDFKSKNVIELTMNAVIASGLMG